MSSPTITTINISTLKSDLEAEYRALVDGMTADLPDVTTVLMAKTSYTKEDLVNRFKARITASENTKAARTALHLAVATERQVQAEVAPLRAGMKAFLALRFGKNSPEMQKFGFTQAKKPQKTVQSKATGLANADATRKARGTMGKKQKSLVKGTAMTVVATPKPTAPQPTTGGATPPAATSSPTQPTQAPSPAPRPAP